MSSFLIEAAHRWDDALKQTPYLPSGLFELGVHGSLRDPQDRYLEHWSYYHYNLEFWSEFDGNVTLSEGELTVYNLSDATIKRIRPGRRAAATGGYGIPGESDQGVWLSGFITGVDTRWNGGDKTTHITVQNGGSGLAKRNVSLTFAGGTRASHILWRLATLSGYPVAEFAPAKDKVYSRAVTVEGDLNRKLEEYAALCGVWAFLARGMLYIKDIRHNHRFNRFLLNETTGLIGKPTPCRPKRPGGDQTMEGYEVRSLLNHRICPGIGIELASSRINGVFTVLKGRHVYNGVGGYTDMTLVR